MRRGLSPVIASLLLVFITIIMASATYFWLSKSSSEVLLGGEETLRSQEKELYGKLSIVSVWNVSTQICILIRNKSTRDIVYSKDDLKNLDVLIDNHPYAIDTTSLYTIVPGESEVICVCNTSSCGEPFFLYSGGGIKITIVPPFGKGDEEVFNG